MNVSDVLLQMHANSRTEIPEVFSGDIAGAIGLKNTTTGDSLTDARASTYSWIKFASSRSSYPIDQLNLNQKLTKIRWTLLLQKLAEEDPTFRAETNPETGQTVDFRYG